MIIERTDSEVIFRCPSSIGTIGLDKIARYLKYIEAVNESSATEDEVNKIADESKKRWWAENKNNYIS
jgi:hypothetical protein